MDKNKKPRCLLWRSDKSLLIYEFYVRKSYYKICRALFLNKDSFKLSVIYSGVYVQFRKRELKIKSVGTNCYNYQFYFIAHIAGVVRKIR